MTLGKENSDRSVLIIYTGGTIGMMEDPNSGSLIPVDFNKLSEKVPELDRFPLEIDAIWFSEPLDSSNVNPEHWAKMAQLIETNYHDYDGFVILHGTDTIAYTASALSFMFENLGKPVILTGSQLPIDTLRTDGRENLITAIQLAGMESAGKHQFCEVGVYFGSKLMRGNRTHKNSAEDFDGVISPNLTALAEVGTHIFYHDELLIKPSDDTFFVNYKLENQVAGLKLFPGIREEVVRAIFDITGLKGVVLESFGSGNAPTDGWFKDVLSEADAKGIIVLNVTQCQKGFVEQGRYATSKLFLDGKVVSAGDMTFESAITKLMYLLGQTSDIEQVRRDLVLPIRGELTNFSKLI